MINTGEIAKKDLLKLWSQKEFDQHMPNNDMKEFIITIVDPVGPKPEAFFFPMNFA
jgi:hypothetical protein